jgi:exosortase
VTTFALQSRRLATSLSLGSRRLAAGEWRTMGPAALTAVAFVALFHGPMTNIVRSWWNEPDAGHGLLLFPLALYLAWKGGISPSARAQRVLGIAMLSVAVVLRYLAGLAAELFTMRFSMVLALFGLVVFAWGVRQLMHWWLPVLLIVLSIPLPVVVLSSLALPLQLKASQIGAALLEWRQVPVLLNGNVIHLPGRTLFVAEACSGLRSLTSLIALGVLVGGLWLRFPAMRALLVLLTLPVAILLNGLRVFLTGFLVFFVDPKLGEGFMHLTEGWIIFVVAFAILGAMGWVLLQAENLIRRPAQ